MRKLTIIIPTYNEEENLKALLPLIDWADELLIVDSFSEDKTVEVAQQFGAKVLQRKYINSANQKNWIIPKAAHEWILLFDADERPRPELIHEIKALLSQKEEPNCVAYKIGLQNHFLGQPINYSGWGNDTVIRLFKRDVCRYEEKHVHADIITDEGEIGKLNYKMDHYPYRSMKHFLAKMERYSDYAAQDYLSKTPKVGLFHLWVKPGFRFFKHFFMKRGFLDGRAGFIISYIMAWGVFLRYVKIQEIHLNAEKKKNK